MGDVRLPLRLSTSFYIDVSTASSLDDILSSGPLHPFIVLGHTIFKSFKKKKLHHPKPDRTKKKKLNFRFPCFCTAASKRSVASKKVDNKENRSEIEEIHPAPSALPIASRGGELMRKYQTYLVTNLILTSFSIFWNKMTRAFRFSLRGVISEAKRGLVVMAAAAEPQALAGRSRDRELCNKRILMGRKCHPLDPEPSVYGDDDWRKMAAAAVVLPEKSMEDLVLELSLGSNLYNEEKWFSMK